MSQKITEMSVAAGASATDIFPIVQSGVNYSLSVQKVLDLFKDTDVTLAANSDSKFATQKAVKTFVENLVTGLFEFKGSTDCSANPNYPSANKGDMYVVTVAGRIGGASGKQVDIGDVFGASADNAGGTEASVGTSWFVLEHNLIGAALTSDTLAQFAATTSSQLFGVIIDKTGSSLLVFSSSPELSGTPTAPTASAGTNTTQLATTGYVNVELGGAGTTVGRAHFNLANPSSVRFVRINADNTLTALAANAMLDALTITGADIASGATTDIAAASGESITITGTTTITALGTATAGIVRIATFSGILTLTHNSTSLILPSAASIVTAAGDVAAFLSLGSGNWRCLFFTRNSGKSLTGVEVYSGSFTRDMATASGTQVITGVGFKPKALTCVNCGTQGCNDQATVSGHDDGVTRACMEVGIASVHCSQPNTGVWRPNELSASFQIFSVTSFNSDGFTVTWTKAGTPTGTATVSYLAIR